MPQREQPEQSYRPACRARFVIRFEEFGAGDAPAPPFLPPHMRKGTTAKTSTTDNLEVVPDESGRLSLQFPGLNSNGPQEHGSSADQRTFEIEGVIPTIATLHLNSIREPDTLELTFNFNDLPIDPRVVRSVGVTFYMGCMSDQELSNGINNTLGTELNVLPDKSIDSQGRERDNQRFQGWVDEWETDFTNEDAPMSKMSCVDNTTLLKNNDAPPSLRATAGKPIDRAVADYLANFPQMVGMSVEYRPKGITPPTLTDVLAPTAKPKDEGPTPAGTKIALWDYISDIVGTVGHICFIEGTTIVIQQPRTLYSNKFPGRDNDPFRGRILPSGRTLEHRLYIYGRNLDELVYRRKYGRHAPLNIEVRSYSGRTKQTIIARHPPLPKNRQSRPLPGNATDQKWMVIRVQGVEDETALQKVAQAYYEGLGRRELGVDFTTKNLGSFGGGNYDPDALDVRPGDTIDVEIVRDGEGNTVTSIEDITSTRAREFLKQLGYSDDFAAGYAEAVNHMGLQTTFRVMALTMDWDADEGITMRFECCNYVEIRADVPSTGVAEPSAEDAQAPEAARVTVVDP